MIVHQPACRLLLLALCTTLPARAVAGQAVSLRADATEWTSSDSMRFETYLGRPSIYISKGVAFSRTAHLRNGTIEFDIAADRQSSNMGIAFRAQRPDAFEVLFFRPGLSGRVEAMQYAPAINSIGAAWQIYHGSGANAKVDLPRDTWIHVKLHLMADSADIYVGNVPDPVLRIPRLVLGGDGTGLALWAGIAGAGGHYSNIRYEVDSPSTVPGPSPALPRGTIQHWRLSQALDAEQWKTGELPDLGKLTWDAVQAEWPGLVLVNRYRRTAGVLPPTDFDSLLVGRVPGSKVVFARTEIESDRPQLRLMQFGYSDNVVIYCNGQPLFYGVNSYGTRGFGWFEPRGDAVYLPLKKGKNEIVFAVTEFFGGWAFSGLLTKDPLGKD